MSPCHRTQIDIDVSPCSDCIGLVAWRLSALTQPSKQLGRPERNRKSPQSLPQFVAANCTRLTVRGSVLGWDAIPGSGTIVMGNGP